MDQESSCRPLPPLIGYNRTVGDCTCGKGTLKILPAFPSCDAHNGLQPPKQQDAQLRWVKLRPPETSFAKTSLGAADLVAQVDPNPHQGHLKIYENDSLGTLTCCAKASFSIKHSRQRPWFKVKKPKPARLRRTQKVQPA